MKLKSRRKFLEKALSTLSGFSLSSFIVGCHTKEKKVSKDFYINFNKKFHWKIVTAWPPHFPILGEGVDLFAKWVEKASGGRMKISVYGGGELAPAMEGFDAVSQGAVEMGHGASYYWAGKAQASTFFTSIPFGMNAQQMHSWILAGGGLALWRKMYEPFNVIPFLGGNMGTQMGGWFNKEINTLEDLKGLKMRIPFMGGKVLVKAGGTAISVAGGELYTNLERGVIDALEWIGPYHDYMMGFHEIAKYYYYPGWHEPGSCLEFVVNRNKWNELPSDLQAILEGCMMQTHTYIFTESEARNAMYLPKIQQVKNLQIKQFPDEVIRAFKKYMQEVIDEQIQKDALSKEIYNSFLKYQQTVNTWASYSDEAYFKIIRSL
ncbi:MAG: TRAP transporter substrate-binding protein [Cytophagales bacterium]|nr:TRAP transporter substrate-binding protein [Cytophagales bacterium]MDW8384100.1 TRAP transporter substrate-binding protein [Flammeovirgaceae bacterium]